MEQDMSPFARVVFWPLPDPRRRENKSVPQPALLRGVLAGRRFVCLFALWLACLPGPAAAAIDCAVYPEYCCYGYSYGDIRVCSRHGHCKTGGAAGSCVCNDGWTGVQCETATPCGNDPEIPFHCNGHGSCQNNACRCNGAEGYAGKACGVLLQPLLLPTALDFGPASVGGAAQSQTVGLTTALAASVGTITLGGTHPGDFRLGGTCVAGAGLADQGGCSVTVDFVPTAPGARSATLSVTTSASATPLTATLAGSGTVVAQSILIDPADASRLYTGLDGGGVYASTDGGATWTAATSQPGSLRVKALAKKSGTPLYAGTYGGGVFQAASGTAFAPGGALPASQNVLTLALDAASTLYAGTDSGVYASGDQCASWSAMNTGLPN